MCPLCPYGHFPRGRRKTKFPSVWVPAFAGMTICKRGNPSFSRQPPRDFQFGGYAAEPVDNFGVVRYAVLSAFDLFFVFG